MAESYKASKSRAQNRPGWSISFRHPLLKDGKGKLGRKMRRGLGTNDGNVADALVSQMNTILSDESWWSIARKEEAKTKFEKVIVEAFFSELQAGKISPETLRESILPLPSVGDGYARVQLVGTTGAGKTSLLRQLIGSNPDTDRFPSTAPAKTTISDLEVIQASGEFEAVVTFFSEFQIQVYVEESILSACVSAFDKEPRSKVAERLLNHNDQKFRLSYILGAWTEDSEDDLSFDEEHEGLPPNKQDSIYLDKLEKYLERISILSKNIENALKKILMDEYDDILSNERADFESRFEDAAVSPESDCSEEFFSITHDIMDEIRKRFGDLKAGEFNYARSGWPDSWAIKCKDRNQFISQVRWFSSNYWPDFGKLLTPIVQGIRVKGPLFPTFKNIEPRLVLIDGQGLGHTPDSATSVPADITKRFSTSDIILLVDNASQPMQAAPQAVLRAVASSGFHSKLVIVFTHFDQIKGDNLKTLDNKKSHVMASVNQAISSLHDTVGAPLAKAMSLSVIERCIMLGSIDKRNDQLPPKAAKFVRSGLLELIEMCKAGIAPIKKPDAKPIYDPTGIGFAVRDAVTKFIGPWMARLGLGSYAGVHAEHFSKVKALNRRIAGEMDIEYGSLMPVSDLLSRLSESISVYLDKPTGWSRTPANNEEAEAAISQIRRNAASELHNIALQRIVNKHLNQWRKAYEYRGTGSARERALVLRQIYEAAAPIPDTIMTDNASDFVIEIRKLVENAIKNADGEVKLAEL